MEGPTPVSSLIHAATMVTAGVYLIARMHPLFELAPSAQDVGAIIGAATLFIAGTIGLAQTDIKKVIAYSTMSQIGYMIMGVSVGAYAAGHVPPDDARLLQGSAVHGGRLDHRRDGRRAVPRPHGRLQKGPPLHLRLLHHRRPRPVGHPALLRLLLQGRDPARHGRAGRLALGALRRRLHRRLPDGRLHLPDDLPRLPRQARRRGPGARSGPPAPRRAPDQPRARAKSRTSTSASRARPTRSPSGRCR